MSDTLKKIQEIKSYHAEDDDYVLDEIRGWYKDIKLANVAATLAEHPTIKDICTNYEKEIKRIDGELSGDETLTEIQRHDLFTKKKMLKEFLKIFVDAKATVKGIEAEVDANYNEIKNN